MSADRAAAFAAALLAMGCESAPAARAPTPESGAALAVACAGRDGWSDPAPPARIFANVHYVGTCGITVLLLTSPQGHVLIDGATAEAAPQILTNIRRLGFDPADIRYLLSGHEHDDHVGGLAALQRATGAKLAARAEARTALETGAIAADDPQLGVTDPFEGTKVDRLVADGEVLRVGPIEITVHATPGHTAGSTSWSWRSCEGDLCRTIAYADSLTAVSADGYRFADHPERVAPFRTTFEKVAALPCDILITPHPGASRLFARLAGEVPLAEPGACADYAGKARQRLDARLAKEAAE